MFVAQVNSGTRTAPGEQVRAAAVCGGESLVDDAGVSSEARALYVEAPVAEIEPMAHTLSEAKLSCIW